MPQKAMRQHRREHMVMPARLCADCIVVHPQCGFAFFDALFHGPPQTTEPDKSTQGSARRSMTDRVGIRRLGAHRPLNPTSALR